MEYNANKGKRLIYEFGGASNCVLANIYEGDGSPSHYLYVISKNNKNDFYDFAHSCGEFKKPFFVEFDEITLSSRLI